MAYSWSREGMSRQEQFLEVVERCEAWRRWCAMVRPQRLGTERVALGMAWNRVLAEEVVAPCDVPPFDRALVDGYALCAADTFGAFEEQPVGLILNDETLTPGRMARCEVRRGTATPIATGAPLPRGADSVAMVETTFLDPNTPQTVFLTRPTVPGRHVGYAGSDVAQGEIVLRRGQRLTARETAILAALGLAEIQVVRRPRVMVLSTGDEICSPGQPLKPGQIYDANATLLGDSLREWGAEVVAGGVVPDNPEMLDETLNSCLKIHPPLDLIVLSGGTSKGAGDACHRVLTRRSPGIAVHGVALKPGKPVCLGGIESTDSGRIVPVAVLPGFPTSAAFTLHEFIAPLVAILGGTSAFDPSSPEIASWTTRHRVGVGLDASLPERFDSEPGRTEYVLVHLVEPPQGGPPLAYPLGKGSGSVSAFARADGFVVIPTECEYLDASSLVKVIPLGAGVQPADLMAIGSHCAGLDRLLSAVVDRGFSVKSLNVGSQMGLEAARRSECDLAGVHLYDPTTQDYNRPFVPESVELIEGYGRMQGVVIRGQDEALARADLELNGLEPTAANLIRVWAARDDRVMVNRNRGSGTRVLLDGLLQGSRPAGFGYEVKSHHAVAAAVAQGRADWGVAIAPVAAMHRLRFWPLTLERFDFLIPKDRLDRPAIRAFLAVWRDPVWRQKLIELGFVLDSSPSTPTASRTSEG